MICMGDSLDNRWEYWRFGGSKFSSWETLRHVVARLEVHDGLIFERLQNVWWRMNRVLTEK